MSVESKLYAVINEFRRNGLRAFGSLAMRYRSRRDTRRRNAHLIGDLSGLDLEERFTRIYHADYWGSPSDSKSGAGSTLLYTTKLRAALERYLVDQRIGLLFDAPCGDFNWMKEVSLPAGCHYLGGDIVKDLVQELTEKYASPVRRFVPFDITTDVFPDADVWLCRDCLFHLSFADIRRALDNFAGSDVPVALISNHSYSGDNTDIETGEFRLLDLKRAPFNFPEPTLAMKDWIRGFPKREVCLWTRDQILDALGHIPEELR